MNSRTSSTTDGAAQGAALNGTPLDRPSTDPDAMGANDQPSADAVASESTIEFSNRDHLIRQAAYRRYLECGSAPGSEEQDWRDAEVEIEGSRRSD